MPLLLSILSMARPKNTLETVQITLQVKDSLEQLTETGFYGKNAADTAHALLKERIRELMQLGQLPNSTRKK
jgi:hypothetical protein